MKKLTLLLFLFSMNVSARPPDNKTKISIEHFINNFIDSLEKKGICKYVSVIEIIHFDQNIEPENYGLIYWYEPKNEKYVSLYVTNNCRKNRARCTLIGTRSEYKYILLKPELEMPFEYYKRFKDELYKEELLQIKDSLGLEVIPLPYYFQKIRIETEFGQLSRTIEKYRFYSRIDLESTNYLKNTESKLFPLHLILENLKNETIVHGDKIKLQKIRRKNFSIRTCREQRKLLA